MPVIPHIATRELLNRILYTCEYHYELSTCFNFYQNPTLTQRPTRTSLRGVYRSKTHILTKDVEESWNTNFVHNTILPYVLKFSRQTKGSELARTVTLCVHFLNCLSSTERQKFTPVYNKGNIICSYILIFYVYVGDKEDNSEKGANQGWKWAYTRTDVVYLVPGSGF